VDADGPALPHWRPLLYREVRLNRVADRFDLVPRQPGWSVNPQLPHLIERLEACPDGDLEALGEALARAAASRQHHPPVPPLDQRILDALDGLVPGIAGELAGRSPRDDAGNRPGPWILFAADADDSGSMSQLVCEYLQLEARLREDPSDAGGLRLLEDGPAGRDLHEAAVLPLVPLSGAQRQAVEGRSGASR
jgi:hypothetical protein